MNNTEEIFQPFPKITRLHSRVCITEKIDGTNAQIYIGPDGEFITGSRNRVITPEDDNYGFSRWAHDHKEELLRLGPGRHFGEWWGQGIQRKYGMDRRVFSLFNVHRHSRESVPECCDVVPVVYRGEFSLETLGHAEEVIRSRSLAAEHYRVDFKNAEGLMIFFENNGMYLKHPFNK